MTKGLYLLLLPSRTCATHGARHVAKFCLSCGSQHPRTSILPGNLYQANVTANPASMHGTNRDFKAGESRPGLTRLPQNRTLIARPKWPISSILHPDPTWCPRGAKIPGNLRKPGCIGPSANSYLKGTLLVASRLPWHNPAEGAMLNFFEPKSGLAETAHFQPPARRGYWQDKICSSGVS